MMKHISKFMPPCPHCGKPVNPASLMGKQSQLKRKETPEQRSERMKKVAEARWNTPEQRSKRMKKVAEDRWNKKKE